MKELIFNLFLMIGPDQYFYAQTESKEAACEVVRVADSGSVQVYKRVEKENLFLSTLNGSFNTSKSKRKLLLDMGCPEKKHSKETRR